MAIRLLPLLWLLLIEALPAPATPNAERGWLGFRDPGFLLPAEPTESAEETVDVDAPVLAEAMAWWYRERSWGTEEGARPSRGGNIPLTVELSSDSDSSSSSGDVLCPLMDSVDGRWTQRKKCQNEMSKIKIGLLEVLFASLARLLLEDAATQERSRKEMQGDWC
jgi:hypothetical protein